MVPCPACTSLLANDALRQMLRVVLGSRPMKLIGGLLGSGSVGPRWNAACSTLGADEMRTMCRLSTEMKETLRDQIWDTVGLLGLRA